ncbi:MAG TPA: TonB-dependent receptor, partial [Saprospiraceae bacterium]|nr:TonB-dependent receptor [Saprospiraceae bacterium]
WVYWSNWAGLGDATRTMQVQRGLGASKLAINSVGGTMNIITKSTDATKGGSVKQEMSSYGQKKTIVSLSSGLMDNGLAVTAVGSRTSGTGYVDGTYIDAWSYYLGIAKQINESHKLQFTVIGAPQKHGQRDNSKYSAQSFAQAEQNGAKYNPNWGYAAGEFLNERNNFYHKPQIALNHYWTVNEKNFLATSAYISFGSGGGSGILGRSPIKYGPGQNALGQRNWDHALDLNSNIPDSLASDGAYLIMRNSMNNHFWTGVLSTLKTTLNDNVELTSGLDIRHYKGEHYREVRDLLGAKFWKDKVNPEAKVGDRIAYDNDGIVTYGGLFAQAEYSNDAISAFIGGSVSNSWFGREDRYNFARGRGDLKAEGVSILGYNAKAGLNYKIDEHNNIFFNTGYYSRAPFHNFVYINYGNTINPNLQNEKVIGFEAGYGLNMKGIKVNLNGFMTKWNDRWVKQYVRTSQNPNGVTAYFQIKNQTHQGLELELKTNVSKTVELGAIASVGSFTYKGDFDATIYDEQTREVKDTVSVFADGLHVGDQPQSQYGGFFNYHVGNFEFGAEYIYYDRLFAKFEVAGVNSEDKRKDVYQLPSYGSFNANFSYNFNLTKDLDAKVYVQGYNLTNVFTPVEGWGNDKDDFKGFWTWGRNFNFGMKVNF